MADSDTVLSASPRSHVDWASILAGATLATAIGLILLGFGSALGLSAASPYEGEGLSPVAFIVAAGLWLLWVQVFSFYVGGYVTARLRARDATLSEHETDVRDGLHGILSWAVGVIVAGAIAIAGITGVTAAAQMADDTPGIAASVTDVVTDQVNEEVDQAAATEAQQGPPEATTASAEDHRAEIARRVSIISAFITAASLLAGAVAAFVGAGNGGEHRDRNTRMEFFVQRRPEQRASPPPPQA